MFRLIGFVVKLAVFSVIVLVLGHLLRWDGKTISDQVRTQMAQVEKTPVVKGIKERASDLVTEAGQSASDVREKAEAHIPSSERQKLRTLIRELNGSVSKRD